VTETNQPVALVTGASRGIGRAIVLALSAAGYRVAGVSRAERGAGRPGAVEGLQREIESHGGTFLPIAADVADLAGHQAVVARACEAFGRLDLLVGNAGIAPSPRLDVLEMTPESFDRVLGVNLRGNVFLAQAVARTMVAAPRAPGDPHRAIVFVTSQSAALASVERAEYCISKAGASMAARVLALRLAAEGIGVYEVRPGIIRTDMTAGVTAKYDRLIAAGGVPQRRWGEPEDIARVVVALARGDLAYSTGAVIEVDGALALPRL
jgi:NAD(P)-dependent dehydrogenase (short-subunit alcohol dehydrogenase family)